MAQTISGNGVIDGTESAEIIKGGKGDDIITGGKGNDTITGGTGFNTIVHHKGDGNDVINLTKGENLLLKVDELADGYVYGTSSIKYSANKKDVLVYISEDEYITIKNIGAKDVTNNATKKAEDTSSVLIQVGDEPDNIIDIRNLAEGVWPVYVTTKADKNFTGGWLNDEIDASDAYLTKTVKVNGKKETVEKAVTEKGLKLDGGKGNDFIIGSKYSDTLIGGDGDDMLFGGDGNDVINGGKGNDMIEGGAGKDTITGGTGENTVVYGKGSGNDIVNLTKGEKLTVELTGIENFEDVKVQYAKNKKDVLIFADKDNPDEYLTLKNYATNSTAKNSSVDLILNGVRKDLYVFTETAKHYTGTMLNDVIDASAATKGLKLNGGAGDDIIIGGKGNDTITGGKGTNIIAYGVGDGNDVINLTKGENFILELYGIADDSNVDVCYAENKKDLLVFIDKNNRNEYITIKNFVNNDKTDSAILRIGEENINLKTLMFQKEPTADYTGTVLDDWIDASGYSVEGQTAADRGLVLDAGKGRQNQFVFGSDYSDTIYAGELTEKGDMVFNEIDAGDGNDVIIAGKSNDVIYGGKGNDTITGGAGWNEITYFEGDGHDVINLTKGEQLAISFREDWSNYSKLSNIAYEKSENGKDLVIWVDKDNHDKGSITIKNFIIKDTTNNATKKAEDTSFVNLFYADAEGNEVAIDLRKDISILTETDKNFTGTWLNDEINAKDAVLYKTLKVDGKKVQVEKADTDKGLTLNGGAGNDTIIGTKYSDTIKGGDGNDVINGGTGNDNLYGGKGDDIISSGGGKNTIYGEEGKDIINVTEGENVVYGGKDNDVINTSLNAKNTYVFNNKDGHDVINVNGDKLSGDIQSDIIKLTGVKKNGFSVTTDGDDVVISYNADKKGVYQDSVTISDYLKSSADLKDITIVTKDKKQTSLNELLKGQFTEGRELSSSTAYETFYGSFANDTIKSSGGYTTIYGGAGDDVITANAGYSVVYGGDGNDTISTAGAKSTIYGGKGDDVIKTNSYVSDVLVFENGDGHDVIEETVKFSRNSEADTIKLTGVDKDGFTQAISGNDLVISYNADSEGNYQDSITIKDFLKNPDDIPNYKIVTNDGYESTANMEYLKEEVAGWLSTYTFDDVASGLEEANDTQRDQLINTFVTANNEQIIPGLV